MAMSKRRTELSARPATSCLPSRLKAVLVHVGGLGRQLLDFLAVGDVEHGQALVGAADGDVGGVVAVHSAQDGGGQSGEDAWLAVGQVPDAHLLVGAAGQQAGPIGTQDGAVNGAGVGQDAAALRRRPEPARV